MVYTSGERVKEIVKIFTKYGLSYIVDKKNKKDKKSPANLRKAFEELGPTFIKIGQILSTRSDLIGEEYIRELSKLQDKAAIEGFSEFEEIFRNEFSKELLDSFLYINKEPIASASIAQVYFGVLNDGREVVIKIQRPNIKERMYIDLDILISLSEKYNHIFKESVVSVKDTLMEIKKSTVNELDFISEANNIRKFRELNKERNYIYAPYVVNELSGEKVLTLENINGFKINDIKVMDEYGYDKDNLAKELTISYFKQVMEDGFFHADPHPGNILISNGKICFIDFGMVGELSHEFISRLNNVIIGLVIEDIDIVVDFILYAGIHTGTVKREILYEDVEYLYNKYFTISIKNIKLSIILEEVMEIAKKNNLKLPSEFTMLIRSMIILEGIIAELSPDVNIISLVISYVKDNSKNYLFNNISMEDLFIKWYKVSKIPEKLVELTNTFTKGRAKVNLKIDNNKYMDEFNKMINRLSFSLIIAGMIVGSSIIINSNPGPKIHGVSIIGLVGYLVSAILGLWLLISIIMSGSLK